VKPRYMVVCANGVSHDTKRYVSAQDAHTAAWTIKIRAACGPHAIVTTDDFERMRTARIEREETR